MEHTACPFVDSLGTEPDRKYGTGRKPIANDCTNEKTESGTAVAQVNGGNYDMAIFMRLIHVSFLI